jgi:rod shape-determining protein MreB
MFFGTDIGIDLGTASVLIYEKGEGIVLEEPSVVAVDSATNEIVAVGEEAREMLGRTPDSIKAVRPLKEGVISDFSITERMLRYFIEKAIGRHWFRKPRIAVCVPSKVTGVEKRAVQEAARNAGARQVYVIDEPIAAAIGAGIDISRACGSLVIDIGGGTADVAVISLGGSVVSDSLKIAGDDFDDAILRYIKKKENVLIGERTAEEIKMTIGTVSEDTPHSEMEVKGRNIVTGLPVTITITSEETREAMEEDAMSIVQTICGVLEKTPPELASDILERGIVLTGGGSLLTGVDRLIEEKTGIKTVVADDAIQCVAIGTGRFIEYQTQSTSFFASLFGK